MPIIPIIGARKLPQFQDNLACTTLTLDPAHLARLEAVSQIKLGFPHEFYDSPFVKNLVYGGMRDRIDA